MKKRRKQELYTVLIAIPMLTFESVTWICSAEQIYAIA